LPPPSAAVLTATTVAGHVRRCDFIDQNEMRPDYRKTLAMRAKLSRHRAQTTLFDQRKVNGSPREEITSREIPGRSVMFGHRPEAEARERMREGGGGKKSVKSKIGWQQLITPYR